MTLTPLPFLLAGRLNESQIRAQRALTFIRETTIGAQYSKGKRCIQEKEEEKTWFVIGESGERDQRDSSTIRISPIRLLLLSCSLILNFFLLSHSPRGFLHVYNVLLSTKVQILSGEANGTLSCTDIATAHIDAAVRSILFVHVTISSPSTHSIAMYYELDILLRFWTFPPEFTHQEWFGLFAAESNETISIFGCDLARSGDIVRRFSRLRCFFMLKCKTLYQRVRSMRDRKNKPRRRWNFSRSSIGSERFFRSISVLRKSAIFCRLPEGWKIELASDNRFRSRRDRLASVLCRLEFIYMHLPLMVDTSTFMRYILLFGVVKYEGDVKYRSVYLYTRFNSRSSLLENTCRHFLSLSPLELLPRLPINEQRSELYRTVRR